MKTISILGCGWLGFPLAKHFVENNFCVNGSSTSTYKQKLLTENGIDAYIVTADPELNNGIEKFFESDILVINIPPGGGDNKIEYHARQIDSIKTAVIQSRIKKVLFVSSTSVYNENNNVVIEDDAVNPVSASGKALLAAEKILFNSTEFKTTIVRFGGLIGADRNPGKYFAGRSNVNGGDAHVNLIHLDDCIQIIFQIVKLNIWGDIFNAVADDHPTIKEFYTKAALALNLEPPKFLGDKSKFKIVSSEKLKQKLGYNFKFPDPSKSL